MKAAAGKLYLLGGDTSPSIDAGSYMEDPSRLEVFDPHTGAWYTAAAPLPNYASPQGHVLLSNQAGGILLMMGGALPRSDNGDWNESSMAMFDIRAGEAL
jgi:hypothetical protein